MSADCRERILPLDEFQSLPVLALGSLLEIALNGDVGRTGSLARSSTCRIAVDAVVVPVVFRPFVRSPFGGIRKFHTRILDFPVGGAEFLSEFHGTCRAVFYAASAGHAVFLLHLGGVGTAGHIRSIEQLRGTQGIANLHVAVADCENFAFAVNIGDLMHIAIVLGPFEYFHSLVIADVPASARLTAIVRHISHCNAPVAVVVRTSLVQLLASVAAGADGCPYMPLIALEPIGEVLYVHSLVFHRNGLFHRNYVHSYSGSAHRHHRSHLFERQEGHSLEEHRELRMTVHQFRVHIRVLG